MPLQRPGLCVVIHDVAPATRDACQRLMREVAAVLPVPMTLLAVPRYHCEPPSGRFERWLTDRYNDGHEVALHGYTHLDDGAPRGLVDGLRRKVYTRGEGEFADLTLPEAMRRLTAGVHWFRRLGLPLWGFVAPAWLMGTATWEALRWLDFRYTCTLGRIVALPSPLHDLGERRTVEIASQSVVYSSQTAWRRAASLAVTRAVAAAERRNPVLRLELHPGDAEHPSIRRAFQRLLERELEQRRALTLAEVAERLRRATDPDSSGLDDLPETDGPLLPPPVGGVPRVWA